MKKVINFIEYKNNANVNTNKVQAVESDDKKTSKVLARKENADDNLYDNLSIIDVWEEGNRYLCESTKGTKIISNFVIKPLQLLQTEEEAEFKVECHTTKNNIITKTLKTSDLTSSSKFKQALNKNDIQLIFKGSNENLEDIKQLIFDKQYALVKGSKHIGMVKRNDEYIFLSGQGAIDKYGNNVEDLTIFQKDKVIDTNLCEVDPINKEELIKLSQHLFKFNDIKITTTILGFCASCFLKEKLYDAQEKKLNHLVITGEAGAGKTETVNHVMKSIFGTKQSFNAAQTTKFSNIKVSQSSNTIPYILEEFKLAKMAKSQMNEISDFLRNSYDGHIGLRGNTSQNVNEYKLLSPIVVVGEMTLDENANNERSLTCLFSKSTTKDQQTFESFKFITKNKQLLNKLGRSLLNEALKIDLGVVSLRKEVWEEKISSKMSARVKNSASNCMLGIELLKDVYTSVELDFEKSVNLTIEDICYEVTNNIKETTLEGGTETKGVIEKYFELFNEMAELGRITYGSDYQVINNGTQLALSITKMYGRLGRYIKDQNLRDFDHLSKKDFIKQLKLKDYYKDYRAVRFCKDESESKKAYIVDIEKLSGKVDIQNLNK